MADLSGLPDKRWSLRGITEEGDEAWLIRGISRKLYRCPACHGEIEIGSEHSSSSTSPPRRHRTPSLAPPLRRRTAGRRARRPQAGAHLRVGAVKARAPRQRTPPAAGAAADVTPPASLLSIYARIGRTYWRWAPSLLLLARRRLRPARRCSTRSRSTSRSARSTSAADCTWSRSLVAVLVIAVTGLVGEVFYTGAVSIVLTHPHDGEQPSLREIAGMINYRRLIAIDLLYGARRRGRDSASSSFPASSSSSGSGSRRRWSRSNTGGIRAAFRRSL